MAKLSRYFPVGSEWLYYKYYTGPKTADSLITDIHAQVISKLSESRIIKKWFFIRYQDPDFHLRLRFQLNDVNDVGRVIIPIGNFIESSMEENKLWKVQIDTYAREIERYGMDTIGFSENIFYYESEMIVQLLEMIDDSDEGERLRWLFGMRAIDELLNEFGLADNYKLGLIENLKLSFCSEFNMDKHLKKQLDRKYAANLDVIDDFILQKENNDSEISSVIRLMNYKTERAKNTVRNVVDTISKDFLPNWLQSHIHMLMNRLFRSKNRLHEMVIYYFLFKYYKAKIGRAKYLMILNE